MSEFASYDDARKVSSDPVREPELATRGEYSVRESNGIAGGARCATAIIVERRQLIRDLLAHSIARSSDLKVVAVASIDECLELARAGDVRVVLLSLSGSPQSEENQQVIRATAKALSGTPTIVLSDGEDLHQIVHLLQTGTRGYISTGMSLDVAIEAIRLVQAGGQFLPASCVVGLDQVGGSLAVKPAESRLSSIFTARQAAVVEALRQGKANKIIAYELKMQESTVKVHVRNIMKKLKAKNRTEVAYITSQLLAGTAQMAEPA